jgi:RNA polymerase sporulation-specific sigma factor
MCYEGLCKAAKGYDETKGVKFSTYAYRCMDNEFYLWFHNNERIKRLANLEAISLSSPVAQKANSEDIVTLEDVLSIQEEPDNRLFIESILKQLNQKEIDYITMYYLEGLTYQQIGDKMGIKYQQAQKIIQNAVDRIKGTKKLRKVAQYTKDGTFIREFDSITDAALFMGKINCKSRISDCCNGKEKTYKGFRWEYVKKLEVS